MASYNVFIIDPFREVHITNVSLRLKQMFDPIAKKAGFDEASFYFPMYRTVQTAPHEMIIYVLPYCCSVVKQMPGIVKSNFNYSIGESHQGITMFSQNQTASEIWCNAPGSTEFFASLIFHELMHNKLQMGNEMHNKFTPREMSAASITLSSSNVPTSAEVDALAKSLKTPVTQWIGGQSLLWDAFDKKVKRDEVWDGGINAIKS